MKLAFILLVTLSLSIPVFAGNQACNQRFAGSLTKNTAMKVAVNRVQKPLGYKAPGVR